MSWDYIFTVMKPMLEGAQMTIFMFLVAIVLSVPFGFGITLIMRSRFKPLAWIAHMYVYVMRGTPLLLQIFFFCFGLPLLPVIGEYLVFDRFVAAAIAFILNYAAYFAEIFRGGLLSVDKGQHEAAKVLGLTRRQTMMKVIIPQMIRVVLPATANESITLIKDTALLYAVSVHELLYYAQAAVNRDGQLIAFFIAAIMYLLMTLVLTLLFKGLEKRFSFE
ncbi:amino acid ABC transporter permease [Paenibacillus amylolyticus]|uniref:amino acid ABC transporter permease n=1 Tax=Paenibacillus amylolyticus TaxID=1451 RepID=UPI00249A34C4|nr:amino acid ABC transporter permease [Paenibacillus amylolyticus]WFA83107.1 amino acid ABC transporter permease [Paenibacillus amylolyticus]